MYRVNITYAEPLTEETGDHVLDALQAAIPEWGPTLSGDSESLTVTVSLESQAGEVDIVLGRVMKHLVDALGPEWSGSRVTGAEVELVRDAEQAAA